MGFAGGDDASGNVPGRRMGLGMDGGRRFAAAGRAFADRDIGCEVFSAEEMLPFD